MTEQVSRILEKWCERYWEADSFEAVDIAMEIVDRVPNILAELRHLNEELEQYKLQEAYLLARLKKAEGNK